MALLTINKTFKWSPNGYDLETIDAGNHDDLPGRAIAIAKLLGCLDEQSLPQKPEKKHSKKKSTADKG